MRTYYGLGISLMASLFHCGCGTMYNSNSNDVYTDHPLVDACYNERPGSVPLDLPRTAPNVIEGRFYMKNHSFSVLIPPVFQNGYIDEDASEPLSIVMFRDASGENMATVNVTQTSRYEVAPEVCLLISKQAFPRWVNIIQTHLASARVIHESEWQGRTLAGTFGLMELPGGVTRQDVGDEDVIRGYLVSFIEDCILHITVQDRRFSFKSRAGTYEPLEEIRAELLQQAVALLESYRNELRRNDDFEWNF